MRGDGDLPLPGVNIERLESESDSRLSLIFNYTSELHSDCLSAHPLSRYHREPALDSDERYEQTN